MHGVPRGSVRPIDRIKLPEESNKEGKTLSCCCLHGQDVPNCRPIRCTAGSELFNKLNEVIESDPDIDEMGLILGSRVCAMQHMTIECFLDPAFRSSVSHARRPLTPTLLRTTHPLS